MDTYQLLQHLGEVEPVNPELLDNVVADVLAAARRENPTPATAAHAGEARRHPRRRPGPRARRALWAAALGSAALVVVVATLSGLGTAPTRQVAGARPRSASFQLVDAATSPFATVGAGSDDGKLECVTDTTCYADAGPTLSAPGGVERTTDGGRTWKRVAAVPGGARLRWPLACPTTQMCMAIADKGPAHPRALRSFAKSQRALGRRNFNIPDGLARSTYELVVTTDGGARWSIHTLAGSTTLPPAFANGPAQLTCVTAEVCLTSAGTELYVTHDGGRTWTAQPPLPPAASPLVQLRCAPDGTCIGINWRNAGVVAIRSTDFGKTWTEGPVGPLGGEILVLSCGDTSHCMAAYPGPAGLTISSTADGGRSWQVSTVPGTSSGGAHVTPTGLVCASGEDCWIAASPYSQSEAYHHAFVDRTIDGGATWRSLPLPSVNGAPLAIIFPMSCPSSRGCIAVGATQAQRHPATVAGRTPAPASEIISDLPAG